MSVWEQGFHPLPDEWVVVAAHCQNRPWIEATVGLTGSGRCEDKASAPNEATAFAERFGRSLFSRRVPPASRGFAMISRFFAGVREELASIDDEIVREALGSVQAGKAQCFEDQYSCTFFEPGRELLIARALGQLDVMRGIADYSGSLVLQWSLREATLAAAQTTNDGILRVRSVAQDPVSGSSPGSAAFGFTRLGPVVLA